MTKLYTCNSPLVIVIQCSINIYSYFVVNVVLAILTQFSYKYLQSFNVDVLLVFVCRKWWVAVTYTASARGIAELPVIATALPHLYSVVVVETGRLGTPDVDAEDRGDDVITIILRLFGMTMISSPPYRPIGLREIDVFSGPWLMVNGFRCSLILDEVLSFDSALNKACLSSCVSSDIWFWWAGDCSGVERSFSKYVVSEYRWGEPEWEACGL